MNTNFETITKKILPVLRRIAYKLNGHFTFFNDEDLCQEALMHLWQDFKEGKLRDKTDSYMLQGCYFHLKNYIRKEKIKVKVISLETIVSEEGDDLEDILSSGDPEAYFEHLNNKILTEDIQNDGLTKREKEVLSFYLEGLTTREMGAKLGISHVRIVKLINRIEEKCRKKFRDEM